MGAAVAGQFSCDACGKSYRWKPELAGRKAKCKCGAVMVCPKDEPGKEQEEDLFELAPDVQEAKPARPPISTMPLAGPLPGGAAPAMLAPSVLPYRAPKSDAEESN